MSNVSHRSDKSQTGEIVEADANIPAVDRSAAGSALSGRSCVDHVRKRNETLRDIQRKIQGLDIHEHQAEELVSNFSSDTESEVSGREEKVETGRERSEIRVFKYRIVHTATAAGEVIPSLPADIIDVGVDKVVIEEESVTDDANDTLPLVTTEPTARPHLCTPAYDVHVYTCRHFLTGLDILELGIFSTLSNEALHAIDTSLTDIGKDEVYEIVGLCFNDTDEKDERWNDFTVVVNIKLRGGHA